MDTSLLHRREVIILTSIEVINEFGIQGLSTREVARRQGISEATIFKHFRTKNELMLAILDHYSQYDVDIADTIRLKKLKPLEAISFLISSYAEYYQNYPQITVITQAYDVLSYDTELAGKIKKIFSNRSDIISDLIREAQGLGEISGNIDSEALSNVIWGSCREVCLKWRLCEHGFPLKEHIMSTLRMILNAFTL